MYKEPYHFPLERFISQEKFEILKRRTENLETPILVIDLDKIKDKYLQLKNCLPYATIYYALKANPMSEILTLLNDLGSNFDVASRYELDQLLQMGISPKRVSFGNTIKKAKDIEYFYQKGVEIFSTDSEYDLKNLAAKAPGTKVCFRIMTECTGADWPLSRKFGAHPDMIYYLIKKAVKLGLQPWGISFHVGSQQRDIGQWDDAVARCKYLFDATAEEGIELKMINIGGGFPANYMDPTFDLEQYTEEVTRFLREDFGDNIPQIILEPGRALVADAGVIVSEVILISKKSKNNIYDCVYLDIGKFGGLIETIDESIKFPIYFDKKGTAEDIILAGPTCDSMDILYEHYKYRMPNTLVPGDRAYIFTAGAYTSSYSSVNFNGFPPLREIIL